LISVAGSGRGAGGGVKGLGGIRAGFGIGIRMVAGSGCLTCTVGGSRSASSSSTVGHDGSSGTQSSAVEYGQRHTLGKGLTRRRSPH
jgi:hypothetical protein